MILKTYTAPTMAEALVEVKKDLGADAVILHTRSYKTGGLLGMGGRQVVEITASATEPARTPTPRRAPAPAPPPARPGVQVTASGAYKAVRPSVKKDPPTPPASPTDSTVAANRRSAIKTNGANGTPPDRVRPVHLKDPLTDALKDPLRDAPRDPPRPRPGPARADRAAAARQELPPAIAAELDALKQMVGEVLRTTAASSSGPSSGLPGQAANEAPGPAPGQIPGQAPVPASPAPPRSPALARFAATLRANDVSDAIVTRLIDAAGDELSAPERADEQSVRNDLLRRIEQLIPTRRDVPAAKKAPGARPAVVALVGPTGVGKTTTIAKLAADARLRRGLRVGLITADTYRIAAVEQLKIYAGIIGLPLEIAQSPEDVARALDKLADCDVVYCDTAGRSQNDTRRLDELAAFLAAAKPDRTHLVLSAAMGEQALVRIAKRFRPMAPTRVILSKLDEAVSTGPILGALRDIALPVSYVTLGQEVPDDIEPANADALARLILDGPLDDAPPEPDDTGRSQA